MRDGIVFYRSFYEAIKEFPPEDFKKSVEAIMEYGLNGTEIEASGVAKAVFILAKPQIDKNNKRYENGFKGGRKPNSNQTETEAEPNANQTETKPEPKEKDKDKEKVKEKDKKSFAPDDESPCAGRFLLNDATEYAVSENDVVTYQQLYPGIDVRQELRNIEAWCLSNPKNRKTRNGAKRFLNAWLSRAQNSARVEKPAPKKNGFNNFNQRQYDYTDLERKLLTAGHGGESSGVR